MNERRFDSLARGLVGPLPRRPFIGALAGALTAAWGKPELALACKNVGRKCDKDNDCCDGSTCKNDKCKCKNGFTKCNKKCYDLDKDEQHCGSCDIRCEVDEQICDNGRCVNVPS